MMRALIAGFLMCCTFTGGASLVMADTASDGRDCYHAGDVSCATDKLLEHFQGGNRPLLRDGRPNLDGQILLQSLILFADNSEAGMVLSRIDAAIAIVDQSRERPQWYLVALHTLRAEQCEAAGQPNCAMESRQLLEANKSNWMMPDLQDSRMQEAFRPRVLNQLGSN